MILMAIRAFTVSPQRAFPVKVLLPTMRIKDIHRYELKYILHRDQCQAVKETLADYVIPDSYGGESGQYTVTSLYFDTADYKAYWDKLDGHRFRRKVRVRVYGDQRVTPETPAFVEIKQRLDKTVSKRRVLLPYASAEALHRLPDLLTEVSIGKRPPTDSAVLEEVIYLHNTLQLQPACIVSYNRLAFNGGAYDPGLRITFDTNLKGRVHDLSLLSEGHAKNYYFAPPEWCVMEIKVNRRVPYWLTEVIGKHQCSIRRISKYCATLEFNHAILNRQHILM